MLCPCKNHMCTDLRAALTLNNYEACLKKNGRHEWFYGTVEVCRKGFVYIMSIMAIVFINSMYSNILLYLV